MNYIALLNDGTYVTGKNYMEMVRKIGKKCSRGYEHLEIYSIEKVLIKNYNEDYVELDYYDMQETIMLCRKLL